MDEKQVCEVYWAGADCIDQISQVLYTIRTHNEHSLSLQFGEMTRRLGDCIGRLTQYADIFQDFLSWDWTYISQILTDILTAQERGDMILIGDLLQIQLVPALQDVLNAIQELGIELSSSEIYEKNIAVIRQYHPELYRRLMDLDFDKKEADRTSYYVEPTSSGYYTLALKERGYKWYLHSNYSPKEEARMLANRYYRVDEEMYALIGFGMGYLAEALMNQYSDMELIIFESDVNIIRFAIKWNDYSELLKKVCIICDSEYQPLASVIDSGYEIIIFRPEIRHIHYEGLRMQLEQIANRRDSIEDFKNIFYQNLRENVRNCNCYVDELKQKFEGKKVIIVAGGPSLDRNVDQLKSKLENVVILAVGTVYKLLLQKGIDIDYVIVSDWKVYPQIQGLEDCQIPILILSTADRRIGRYYQGPKYLICQKGYHVAKEYAEKNQYMCYDSGGSVATLALDVAIRLQAASIAFIGLDLAYYGTKAHAQGTSDEFFAGYEQHRVEGWQGESLNASQVFIQYRQWMERRILESDVTMPIYDATEGGAKKVGFCSISLLEYLKI